MTTTKNNLKNPKLRKRDIYYIVFITSWTILSLLASQLVVSLLMFLFLKEDFSRPLWTLVYYVLSNGLTLALVLWVPPRLLNLWRNRRHKLKLGLDEMNELSLSKEQMGVSQWPTFVDIGLAPIGYIIYIFMSNLLTNLMTTIFPWFNADQEQVTGFGYFVTTGDRLMAIVAIVLIAPIAEELIMRGWFYGKVRSKLGVVPSILLVSLVFALLHGQWNVSVAVFILSIILCGLREITGTIWSGMLLHILTNGIAFYILYIALI